jgi:N-succinyldiaminopimelate aminotransferase
LLYRTYHGSAMSPAVQRASVAAWSDEAHVIENRKLYRQKFERVTPILASVLDVALPDASFYLWAAVPAHLGQGSGLTSDEWFTKELLAQYNVAVLPGSYLAREAHGINPGQGRIRMALVAGVDECVEAAERIKAFTASLAA